MPSDIRSVRLEASPEVKADEKDTLFVPKWAGGRDTEEKKRMKDVATPAGSWALAK